MKGDATCVCHHGLPIGGDSGVSFILSNAKLEHASDGCTRNVVFASTMWLAIPVVIFSFSHAAAISSFANVQRRHYGEGADVKSELILRRTSVMLIAFVLLFVFSCVLALSPEQLAEAKSQNVSVLSYLANATDNPFIATLGPLVAFVAITSSFLGHFWVHVKA